MLHKQSDSTGDVQTVAFHPNDSRLLAWGGTDPMVEVWSAVAGEIRTLRGHRSWVLSVRFGSDREWLASGSLDGVIKLWRVPPVLKAFHQAAGVAND